MTVQNENKKIFSDMMWNTVGNIVYCICQWVITILVVRFASYSEAGYLSLAMSTTSTEITKFLTLKENLKMMNMLEVDY